MRILFLFFLICIASGALAQKSFTTQIKGTADNSIQKVYLKYDVESVTHIDSVNVVNGAFFLKKNISLPLEATVSTDKKLPKAAIFLEDGEYEVNITDSIRVVKHPSTY